MPQSASPARHVALLRGINVGTSKRLPMAELRAIVETAGGTRLCAEARPWQILLSPRVHAAVEEVHADLEREWAVVLGEERLAGLRADLTAVLSSTTGGRLPPVRVVG